MDVAVEQEPQQGLLHRFNSQLPYKSSICAENRRLLANITYALNSLNSERVDTRQVLQVCSGLDRLRRLKYSLDDSSRLHIAKALYDLAFPTTGATLPWHHGNKVMSSLATLIGKKPGRLALAGKLSLLWRPMFLALDDSSPRGFPLGSGSNERSRVVALRQLIHQARHYWAPGADLEIWEEVKEDIVKVQTQGTFKALFLLCLFIPSRTSLYDELLPKWFRLWEQVDHCASWDGAWLTILCRARKYVSPTFDWTPYMSIIYSLARASIHTPVSMGDAGSAPLPGDRHVAYQYNSIAPVASFSAGDKLKKLGKMLVFFLGKGGPVDVVSVSDLAIVPTAEESGSNAYAYGDDSNKRAVSPGAQQLLSLFRGLRTYFQPSNGGWWSFEMALLMNCVLHSLAWRVGEETALREAGQSTRTGELTRDDAGLVVDALLPLVLEMVYSKNSSVGTMSNYCLSTLASLSPKSVTPAVVELVLRALDPVASINHTHQAPAAIRALTSIFRPLMYPRPYLAPYLPILLELTLPGLDANDVFKTTVTLRLYHLILSWVPIQGSSVSYSVGSSSGWKPPPPRWMDTNVADETTNADEQEHLYTACEGLGGIMLEWSVPLLDRIFEVLRHKDKSSKVKRGDLASDTMNVAAAITGLDRGASGMGMFGGGRSEMILSGLIKVVTEQLFTMADEPAAKVASSKIFLFVTDQAVPNVEKDLAAMVEVMASALPAKTVATFFPALCDGLLVTSTTTSISSAFAPGTSPVLLQWRLRLLSGLARGSRAALVPHGLTLRRLIAAGIGHSDKKVRKCGRKLLRKALHGLCELSPSEKRSLPPARWANVHSVIEWRRLCEPLPAGEHDITWVQPSAEGLVLAAELLEDFLVRPMEELSLKLSTRCSKEDSSARAISTSPSVWREHLKTMDYSFRGAVCLLGDRETPGEDEGGSDQHLRDDIYLAVGSQGLSQLLAEKEGPRLYKMVAGLRAEIARFMRAALESCAQSNGPTDVKAAKLSIRLSERVACTRGALAHKTHFQQMLLMVSKSQQRDIVLSAVGKKRFNLALEAASVGNIAAMVDGCRALSVGGVGGEGARPRVLVVERVLLQHWKRLAMAPKALAFAAKDAARSSSDDSDIAKYNGAESPPWTAASAVLERYRLLFSTLMHISYSEYAMVRAAAQRGVNRLGGVYPWFVREAVPELISRLSPSRQECVGDGDDGDYGDTAHRRLTGTCYLLHQKRSMKHVVSTWSLLRLLLLALCDSQSVLARLPTDKQEKAAARVTILFTTYVINWRANPITTEQDIKEHDALLQGLLERLAAFNGAAPVEGGGWRYQLMASWCLMHLIHPSSPSSCGASPVFSIKPSARLTCRAPMAVWHWFANCLSEGDGQPLQRLALGALTRMLSSADPTSPVASDVSELLSSNFFLRSLVLALAHNHRKQATEGGLAGAEQWSLGVKEILQDARRGDTRELFPRLRFGNRSRLFWARNARLVSAVVSAVGEDNRSDCIHIILKESAAAMASAAHEDKRSFDCAAAEVGAGILAVLTRENSWIDSEKVLQETVLPFVETELDGVSLESRLDWTDAIRFALDRSTIYGSEYLVSMVMGRTAVVMQGGGKGRDDYSVLVKWLSFTGAVLIELAARQESAPTGKNVAKGLCPLLVEGLDHPFKACREEIARNFFLIVNATDIEWATDMANSVRESILAKAVAVEDMSGSNNGGGEHDVACGIATLFVADGVEAPQVSDSALLSSVVTMSDGALTEEEKAASSRAIKQLSLSRETVLQWLHQTVSAGDHARYLPILVALLPVALQSVRDSNMEVAAIGRGACLSIAAALTLRAPDSTEASNVVGADSGQLDRAGGIINAVIAAASSQYSWRVRRNAAAVACVLQTRLHFMLTPQQHCAIDAALLSLLGDTRREVQETARLAISTRVAHLTAAQTRILCEKFAAGADFAAASRKKRRKIAKRQAARAAAARAVVALETAAVPSGDPLGAMKEQQTSVLGLSAVVLATPCDVPPWVPEALESLAKHVNDDAPGRLPVRQTVTHTFKEFRRTHQDKWEESHKARFTHDQLDTFVDVLGGAHSYFV